MSRKSKQAHFNPGDIVALRSGSQRMTVVSSDEDTTECVWSNFDTKEVMTTEVATIALYCFAPRGESK